MFKIQTFNAIAQQGLDQFPQTDYQIGNHENPDAILLRSQNLNAHEFNTQLLAVARAGAGVNNVPVKNLTAKGIPVFNTPGANANAVKELVVAGLLLSCRNICRAWHFANQLQGSEADLHQQVEANKKQFVGFELPGRTLAVIGLGAIGVQVANAAIALGMHVIGYDPEISIKRAWQLSANVQQANSLDEALAKAQFVTVHVPYVDATHHLIGQKQIARMPDGAILLNFAREAIIDQDALHSALNTKKIACYVSDFPTTALQNNPQVISLPHLGASTEEAEINCAVMAAETLRDFLENGHIHNAVNFPAVSMPRNGGYRLSISNSNVPNMVGQISTVLGNSNINIIDMINKSRDEVAYTLVDIATAPPQAAIDAISTIRGILKVRVIAPRK